MASKNLRIAMKKRIICEEYIGSENGTPPMDYKIFCFDGEPKLIQLDIDRFQDHKRNVFDIKWNQIKNVEKDGKIYFGEMTFFHGAGIFEYFRPKEFHILVGSWFKIPKANLDTFYYNQ